MGININQLKVQSIQTSFFLRDFQISDKFGVAQGFRTVAEGFLDGEPTILPFAEEQMPPSMSRITLKDRENHHICNVAGDRVDFVFQETDVPSLSITELWSDYISLSQSIAHHIKQTLKVKIWRLGLVVTSLLEISGSGGELLSMGYLKEGIFEEVPAEMRINALHQLSLFDTNINRWLKLTSAKTREEVLCIQVQIDINTLPENEGDFGVKESIDFCQNAYHHILEECVNLIHIGEENAVS